MSDTHGCRLSLSILTDPDSKSEIKGLWSSADKAASQTTICPSESPSMCFWWVSCPLRTLHRKVSLFSEQLPNYILWVYIYIYIYIPKIHWLPGFPGKRHHWSEHLSQSQLSDASLFEINEEYSTLEQVTGACSQKAAQVCQEKDSFFWSDWGHPLKVNEYRELQEKNGSNVCYHPGDDSRQLYTDGNQKKMATGQKKKWVVCRFSLSLSFTEGLWCHWKSVPPG